MIFVDLAGPCLLSFRCCFARSLCFPFRLTLLPSWSLLPASATGTGRLVPSFVSFGWFAPHLCGHGARNDNRDNSDKRIDENTTNLRFYMA